MVSTAEYMVKRRKVFKTEIDYLKTTIYYADGKGICIHHGCRNVSHFDHSYTDPDMPTGGYNIL